MSMKKITLSLAGALAAVAFAPEASAIPAFARQVGMACSACHYQHFPALNQFGRAFKEGGYTMVGAQDKIEGDDISLPVVLNAALVGSAGYTKTNGPSTAVAGNKNSSNDGQFVLPQGVSLFLGGRGGEHVGFEAELALNSGGVNGSAGIIRLKVPFVFDVGSVKAGIIPFATANGVADSFEVLNTGAVNVHAFNQQDMGAVSAQQYLGTGGSGGLANFGAPSTGQAHGIAFIASNDVFFANVAKWGATLGDGSGAPTSNYLRAAWTTDLIPGFDSAIGFQNWSGSSYYGVGSANASANDIPTSIGAGATNLGGQVVDTKAWAIDAQTMGDVAGMPLLVTASYARAPSDAGNANGLTNLFNQTIVDNNNGGAVLNPFTKSSFNVGAELGVIPNKATVQLAFRHANSGFDTGLITGTGVASGANASDNAIMIGATYALALNTRLELTYSKYSGDMYGSSVQAYETSQGLTYVGDQMTAVTLWFGF